jgi:hypothetical protein
MGKNVAAGWPFFHLTAGIVSVVDQPEQIARKTSRNEWKIDTKSPRKEPKES